MIAMRYVFLALMCVFAGIHAAKNRNNIRAAHDKASDLWDSAAGIFFSTAASVMYVLTAIASYPGVKHEAYYTLILIGLCISLATDILIIFNKSGKYMAAGFLFYSIGAITYISALFSYAGLSWREAAIFALLLAFISTIIYNKQRSLINQKPFLLYAVLLCIMAAKALSILFERNGRYLYAVFAAAGAVMLAVSQIMPELNHTVKPVRKDMFKIVFYYAGQGLIALSVMI